MAEGLLLGVVERIVEKLGSFVLQEIGLWWGVKDEIKSMSLTVLGVKAVLHDAESRQARDDDPVKDWLGELKKVVYDAEDLLDDFSTEVLRRKGNKLRNEVRLFFSSSNQLAYGLKMGHKIKATRERLDAVMREGKQFNFRVDNSTAVMAGKREQTHSSPPEVVIGREDDENEIRELLLSEKYSERNVTVISIVGIGGLGKTTLAQRAFQDDNVKKHFNLFAWVCVSDHFDVKLIIGQILKSVEEMESKLNISEMESKLNISEESKLKMESKLNISEMDMETLKESIKKKISGKKYLFILDDVWNENIKLWCSFIDLLGGSLRGSRIIITTRFDKVAAITSQATHKLNGLSDDKSWSLFAQMAFDQGYVPPTPKHEAIGQEIVARCKGVPLVIRVIGILMRSKTTFEWETFKSKELMMMDKEEISIITTLKLSYDHLPSHLKHCFTYCKLFPKDEVIYVDKLVDLWMTQGYIKSLNSSQCHEDIGRECFMDLLWRCFFQDLVEDELGNIISCKMHDLMHDLASSVAGNESVYMSISIPREVDDKTRHISLDINSNNWQVPRSVLEAKGLRTFLTLEKELYNDIGEGQCHAIFCNLRRLRQLDLQESCTKTVPNSIRKLKQLRYLDLSGNWKMKLLPRSITRLQNLQVLKLQGCEGLRQLPKDVKKLVNLTKLVIDGCGDLTHMPRGIGQLTSLERLTRFILPTSENSKRKSGGLGELHDLNKLGGKLSIENLPHHGNGKGNQKGTTPTPTTTGVAETCAAANLSEKPRLQKLQLGWVPLDGDDDTDFNEDGMSLGNLRPHPNLKSLKVRNYGGINFANWLSSLTNLVRLRLYQCPKCRSLPALDQLPSLKEIDIRVLTDLQYIDMTIYSAVGGGPDICSSSSNSNSMVSFFPSLGTLQLYDCPNLKGWRPSSPSSLLPKFQRLSFLWIDSCPNLTSMPPSSPSLERLSISSSSFKSLKQMLKGTISPAHEPSSSSRQSNLSSSLKSLEISTMEQLPEDFLPVELLQTLTSLEYLEISSFPTLTCLPHAKMLLLTSLKGIWIGDCENLDLSNYDDDSNSNSNKDDAILSQGQGLRSLISLAIINIPKLVHLPRRLLLHSIVLQRLEIYGCPNLASLPEWMPNLTSLKSLLIGGCSQLSERCKNNMGEDWLKIAHIPNIEVDWRFVQWDGRYKL